MQDLAHRVAAFSRRHQLLRPGNRVGVAVSGGADSVALLRLLLDLRSDFGLVLSVVHFNHKLRGAESDADEDFVAELGRKYQLPFHCESGDVAVSARGLGIEAAARRLRYEFFHRLLQPGHLDRIATGHTLDDQAETVLLRLARGAGTRGLAGVYPQLSVPGSQFPGTSIVRPLLAVRRTELEAYLKEIGQSWREDSSNRDLRFARNRVRHGILPRLERALNPSLRESLAETAELARAEEEFWQAEVARLLPDVWVKERLNTKALSLLPLALQRRLVRAAAASFGLRLEFAHVEELLGVAGGEAKSANLPAGWTVERQKTGLRFFRSPEIATDYEYCLPIPGRVKVPEAGVWFEASLVRQSEKAEYNRGNSLDPARLERQLRVRNWRAGDRYWPPHTKGPKKIKELLQQRRVTGVERRSWPVLVSGAEVVWLRGFPSPAALAPPEGAPETLLIQEFPL